MGGLASAGIMQVRTQSGRAGDPAGFTEIYRRVGRRLYRTALRMLGRPEDAEEAMQETFLKLYDRTSDIPGEHLDAWLHRVLVNHCLDRKRYRRRRPETELVEGAATGRSPSGGLRLDLQQAVERLPERARQVFLLHDVEGFKHHEVGEMLGVTSGASKSQLFRARELLRGFIQAGPGGAA